MSQLRRERARRSHHALSMIRRRWRHKLFVFFSSSLVLFFLSFFFFTSGRRTVTSIKWNRDESCMRRGNRFLDVPFRMAFARARACSATYTCINIRVSRILRWRAACTSSRKARIGTAVILPAFNFQPVICIQFATLFQGGTQVIFTIRYLGFCLRV